MDGMSVKQLRELADVTFTKKAPINNLHQELAENFYVERADFTAKRYLGEDFAGNLMTSYPPMCRRELSSQIGTMLRNTNKPWFHMVCSDQQREDHEVKAWLEWATGTMRRAMYARKTKFSRATSEADADFATFGQAAMTVRLNRDADDLLFRCYHLRDMAWIEDEDGEICAYFRRWKPSYRTLMQMFNRPGKSVHRDVEQKAGKTPNEEANCYHFMVKADMYDGDAKGLAWRSIYYDVDHQHEMESVAQRNKEYVLPRWLTVSGSQYAHSPATVLALPEARLLQAMTYTLLEAGEKVVNPPIVATEQVVRSDVNLFAGGITWIDREYDEKMGDAMRALIQDSRGMPLSVDMQKDSRGLIMQAFYLNKLSLPTNRPQMTAFEVGQYVEEYVRNALPLFEPMEAEYNGALCEETFAVMLAAGGFGSPMDMPRSLRTGADIDFRFASPLHDAIDQQKGQKFLQMKEMLAAAIAIDKNVVAIPDVSVALRDALDGIGIPTKWTRSVTEVQKMTEKENAQRQTQELLANMGQGATIAKDLATAQAQGAQAQPAV